RRSWLVLAPRAEARRASATKVPHQVGPCPEPIPGSAGTCGRGANSESRSVCSTTPRSGGVSPVSPPQGADGPPLRGLQSLEKQAIEHSIRLVVKVGEPELHVAAEGPDQPPAGVEPHEDLRVQNGAGGGVEDLNTLVAAASLTIHVPEVQRHFI